MTVPAAITIFELAERYKSKSLKDKIEKYIVDNLSEIITTDSFKKLSLKNMQNYIFALNRNRVRKKSF